MAKPHEDFVSLEDLGLTHYPEDPLYLTGEIRPPKSQFSSLHWDKFYHPSMEPMGVPKLYVLDPLVREEMEEERKDYVWKQIFFYGGIAGAFGIVGWFAAPRS